VIGVAETSKHFPRSLSGARRVKNMSGQPVLAILHTTTRLMPTPEMLPFTSPGFDILAHHFTTYAQRRLVEMCSSVCLDAAIASHRTLSTHCVYLSSLEESHTSALLRLHICRPAVKLTWSRSLGRLCARYVLHYFEPRLWGKTKTPSLARADSDIDTCRGNMWPTP
jgi:hypothetical protein